MIFYLGCPSPSWLQRTTVPLFVSHVRLRRRKTTFPRATAPWALDSGGYSELNTNSRWTVTPQEYVEWVHRYATELGGLQWASPQDWMVEPWILKNTGLSVREHQERTVANYLELRELAPELPFIPVLQGWDVDDYHACADLYEEAGVELTTLPRVGVGSVCRRENTDEIRAIMGSLVGRGIRLHGFGVKSRGLGKYANRLVSADSMAWSFRARKGHIRMPGCTHFTEKTPDCRNCMEWALVWRERLVSELSTTVRRRVVIRRPWHPENKMEHTR